MYIFLSLLFCLIFAADQYTKILTVEYLKNAEDLQIIKNVLSLTYVENKGAAFGILQNGKIIFIAMTIIVTVLLILYTIKTKNNDKLYLTSICMIISGAVSNMTDRFTRGFVVDMIKTDFIDFPVFNFADMCIVCGAILLCIYVIFIYKEPEPKTSTSKEQSDE